MAEQSAQDKTEHPTARRREQALEKGQVARSQDLNSVAVLLGGLILLKMFGEQTIKGLTDFSVYVYRNLSTLDFTVESIPLQFYQYLKYIAGIFGIILVGIGVFETGKESFGAKVLRIKSIARIEKDFFYEFYC